MKVYILTDMEGISLVYHWNQVKQGHPFYERYRSIQAREVNAAIEGALEAGATEIVVNDGHGSEDYNLLWEELHPSIYLERPASSRSILPSLDSSFHSMLFVGYHAMEGTPAAVMPHTQSSENWQAYRVNGQVYGEIGQMSLIAGGESVPVAYISGDRAAVEEARGLLGDDLPGTIVKWGFPGGRARSLHPDEAVHRIREDVAKALRQERRQPLVREAPYEVQVTFKSTAKATEFAGRTGVERVDPFTISKTVQDVRHILDL
ncbi:M55 family metallopeptidase [Paenibacillus sp. HJGM_3]|uniref:M55 family metallopeptidase n=1 Tax=Paenibacillus sp. HJGM_3 TaxID=3379816 RepID=UPI00385F17F3